MKVLHVPFSFWPDAPGGTEIYVDDLCRSLRRRDVRVTVAAPDVRSDAYDVDGLRVRRFAHDTTSDLASLYGGNPDTAERFDEILDQEVPDLVHQHALSPAVSSLIARAARRRGIPVVFTYHSPTATCQRGTLLEHGVGPCDGRLQVRRCTACVLDGHGAGHAAAWLGSLVPRWLGRLAGSAGMQGGSWTALRLSSLIDRRHASWRTFVEDVDRFVALSAWSERVMLASGVPASKIVRSPHGIASSADGALPTPALRGPLRLAHMGRTDPAKGTALLIRALHSQPALPVELDIFGIVQNAAGAAVMGSLKQLAEGDDRVRFLEPLPHDEVIRRLAVYDLVVVPSQWMETGPLVVLEAFAAGRPVLGSALGGIAEKVRDGVDGMLVDPYASESAWRAALARCATDPDYVRVTLARGVETPRSTADVADDMASLYEDVLSGRDPASPRES